MTFDLSGYFKKVCIDRRRHGAVSESTPCGACTEEEDNRMY